MNEHFGSRHKKTGTRQEYMRIYYVYLESKLDSDKPHVLNAADNAHFWTFETFGEGGSRRSGEN